MNQDPPPISPFDGALWLTYLWVLVISLFGGTSNFIRKLKQGKARPWNVVEFVGELVVSALAGLITFWLCHAAGVNPWLEAALIAIAGHMGARALFHFEGFLERQWPLKGGKDV
jgi:hypothetical protein